MNDYELALNNIIDAIEMLHRHIEDGSFNHPHWSISKIRELVDNSKKYRRHDLRKNPEDLPEEEKDVLCLVTGYIGNVIYEEAYVIMYYDSDEKLWIDSEIDCNSPYRLRVLAWREIEPLDEE